MDSPDAFLIEQMRMSIARLKKEKDFWKGKTREKLKDHFYSEALVEQKMKELEKECDNKK